MASWSLRRRFRPTLIVRKQHAHFVVFATAGHNGLITPPSTSQTTSMTSTSVVINTFNRAHLVGRAIESVLRQVPPATEIVVVDDGSTDATSEVLARYSDRIITVRQANMGLCAARNTGLAHSTSDWVAFLDDDDFLMPGTLAAVQRLVTGQDVGAVTGGILFRSPHSGAATFSPPTLRDAMFGNRVWNYMPGSFFVRRSLLVEIGGYRPELLAQHQTDLMWRLADVFDRDRLDVASTPRPFVTMERGDYLDRPLMRPELMLAGSQDMLVTHAERFSREPVRHADYLSIVGVNQARLGQTKAARRSLREAVRLKPGVRTIARRALSATPGAGRWWWGRHRAPTAASSAVSSTESAPDVDRVLANVRDALPATYHRNPQASADVAGTPYWEQGANSQDNRHQVPVYRFAASLAARHQLTDIVDVGCGSGGKAVRFLSGGGRRVLGVDQSSAVALAPRVNGVEWLAADLGDSSMWEALRASGPQLAVCADVIEHLDHPHDLLSGLAHALGPGGRLVLSTPNRSRGEVARPFGPPPNPRHAVEWTPDEIHALLAAHGMTVVETIHMLPRSYSRTVLEVKRMVWRALHRQAVPDRKRCMVFVAEVSEVTVGGEAGRRG